MTAIIWDYEYGQATIKAAAQSIEGALNPANI
jgi:hypothetical protein